MGDIDRASFRANILERKKLDQLVSIYESSKRNLISDMRKTQATYRRKLKAYRERKREIMVAKSKNSHTAIDDLLLEQLKARGNISPKSGVKSSSSSSHDTAETLSRQITCVSESSDFEGSKIFKSKLSAYTSDTSSHFQDGMPALDPVTKSRMIENKTIVSVEDVCKTSGTAGHRASRKYLLTAKALPGRNHNPVSTFPGPVSAFTQGLTQTVSPRLKPGTAPIEKVKRESEMRRAHTSCFPSIQSRPPCEVGPGQSEPRIEMPRSSSRQRSRLDLRPRTSWELLNAQIASDARRQAGSWRKLQNNIAGSNCQIVYMDKDELQERGTFYNYLLRGRLEREHSRFNNICHKVQDFCRSPGFFVVVSEAAAAPSGASGERPRSSRRYSVFPTSKNSISGIPTLKQH